MEVIQEMKAAYCDCFLPDFHGSVFFPLPGQKWQPAAGTLSERGNKHFLFVVFGLITSEITPHWD